jgi:hypothetical protein
VRFSALEERMQQCDVEIVVLLGRVAHLEAEVTALRSIAETATAPLTLTLHNEVIFLKGKMDSLQSSQESAATAQNVATVILERCLHSIR